MRNIYHQILISLHIVTPLFFTKRVQKKKPIVMMGSDYLLTIMQALAPWLLPGCCAVNELVSRALFMVA
jgi:hypothetical protein